MEEAVDCLAKADNVLVFDLYTWMVNVFESSEDKSPLASILQIEKI